MSDIENSLSGSQEEINTQKEDKLPTPPKKKSKKKIIIAICIIASALPVLFLVFIILLVLLLRGCVSSLMSDESDTYVDESRVEIVLPDISLPGTAVPDDWFDDESNYTDTPAEDSNSPAHVHEYSSEFDYNEYGHWRQCECGTVVDEEDHAFGEWIVIKSATESEEGIKERTCAHCRYSETETIPAIEHVHSYSSSWVSNNTYHWKVCSCGATANMASHSFGSWKTVTAASCGKTGKRVRSCTACGFEESQTISATSHSYSQGTCVNCGILQSQGLSIGIETVNGRKIAVVYSIGSCKDKNIYIPAKYNGVPVTTIGHAAFRKCTFITSITIPSSVTTIENDAFTGCTGLTRAVFADTTGWYITTTEGASSGSNLSITDQSKAAEYLKTYRHYYWYKK